MGTNGTAAPGRVPLRISLAPQSGLGGLDGGWWPQSRDLELEFADLIEHLPDACGRVVRAVYSPPDWDLPAHRIAVRDRWVTVGAFPNDDAHLMILRTSGTRALRILVVPPEAGAGEARRALRLAAVTTRGLSPAMIMWTLGGAARRPEAAAS